MKETGFTLIELLAVIVILAVIALIATPMILGVIETSRIESAEISATCYIDAVEKQIMINQLDSSKTQITDGVYNLPLDGVAVKGENPSEGWIIIENGEVTTYSMKIMNYVVTTEKETSKKNEVLNVPICKRATTLHTEECVQTDGTSYCSGAGYTVSGSKETTTITYGNLGTSEKLTSGDAFDCDVNRDGIYNSEYERFYFVSGLGGDNTSDIKVLIYYNNTAVGENGKIKPSNTAASLIGYYPSVNENWHGPMEAIKNLPTIRDWNNVSLISTTRSLLTETGVNKTAGGNLPTAFSYTTGEDVYASRLLTYQELVSACGSGTVNTTGYLDNCNYLIENTKYSSSKIETYGYWLENPLVSYSYNAWAVNGVTRFTSGYDVSRDNLFGVRPVIEVTKEKILY